MNPACFAAGITLLLMLVAGTCAGAAPQIAAGHSRLSLISESETVVPGKRLWLGLDFTMDPGWHIYWVNSGDSGEPPSVVWKLPKGFHAGEIVWPVPKRLGQGTVIDYGYENQVLLMVPVQAPANLALRGRVRLAADVEWLVCREICIPAKGAVGLDLPVVSRPAPNPAAAKLFHQARARLPISPPRGWRIASVDSGNHFILTVLTGQRETSALFFPLVPDQVHNAAKQLVNPLPHGVRLTLTKSDLLAKPVQVLTGVLELGSGHAYTISAPVRRAGK